MTSLKKYTLGELIREAKPGFACGTEDPNGVFQMRMNNITKEGNITTTKRRRVPSHVKQIPETQLQQGDVLFNATNSPDMVGKTALIEEIDEVTVYSNHFIRLRPHADTLLPSYLSRWLNLQFQRGIFRSMCRQWVNQATLSKKDLLNLDIYLPGVAQQKHAVDIMDSVGALRSKRRMSIELLDELTQSTFLDMFGDPVTNPNNWKVERLGNIARIIRGASPRPKGDPRYFGGPIPWLMISDVTRSHGSTVTNIREGVTEAGRDKSVYLPKGSLILTNSATVGVPKFLGVDACIHDGFLAILEISPSIKKNYLYNLFLLNRDRISQLAPEGTQKNLNTGIAKSLEIPIPPMEVQEAFVDQIRNISLLRERHQAHLEHLDELFASVQQRAFDGTLWDDRDITV